jgi:6-phosphogluconolactonase (cycloisomerase 2 family)
MRMKFNKSSQLLLVSAASLLVAGLLTACGTLTVDFVFVTSSRAAGPNNYGEIDVFEINSESGFMRQIPTSPFPSGGRNPVAEAVSSDNTNLYVVNHDDNTIVQFIIGNDGKLYPQNTYNTPGVFPLGVAVNGSNLFVVDTYQPLPSCSPANPCSGSIAVYPIISSSTTPPSDSLQPNTPINNCNGLDYVPLGLTGSAAGDAVTPTAVTVLANGSDVFISSYDTTTNTGYVFGFSIGTTSCPNNAAPYTTIPTLTALSGSPWKVGVHPSAITGDSSSSYVYVTDMTSGNVRGYSVASSGLTELSGSPFRAGNQPSAIVADPSYPFIYVTNSLDDTINAYSMANGALTSIGSYATGLQPVAIGIDPSTNHFLYTANYLGNTVSGTLSGYEVSATAGTLINSQNSPYTSNAQPTAVAAIPHNGTGGGIQK